MDHLQVNLILPSATVVRMANSADIRNQLAHIHDDRSGQIAVIISVMIVVATTAVSLRLVTRWLIAAPWKLDDYAIIAALVSIQFHERWHIL